MKIEKNDIITVRQRFEKIQNENDFVTILNDVNQIIYEGMEVKLISLSRLKYYANIEKCKNRYSTFEIKKKSGGVRVIQAPKKGLKSILKTLNFVLPCVYEPHNAAMGFVLDKSIVDNAKIHCGHRYVYNIDLKDFFHSFDRNRVKIGLMSQPFNLSGDKEPIAFLIACLVTHVLDVEGEKRVVLPQGSPASPTITNILCKKLDQRLSGLAKRFGTTYSRYADDITFSSYHSIFNDVEFQKELRRIIEEDQHLEINPNKTRLQKNGFKQEVTGLTVNEKVNVNKRYVKQIRMWLYYWEKYGYEKAQQIFTRDYILDKGHVKKHKPRIENVLDGKLEFLKMVKGETDSTFLALKRRLDNLTYSNSGLPYILQVWEKEGIDKAIELSNKIF